MEPKIFDFTENNGLVFCNNIDAAKNNAEILYINDAQKLKANAVFFRRFYKDGVEQSYHSEPAVCIFERDDTFFNTQEHIDLHAKLWSAGKNEVYVINGNTRFDIINARKPAEVQQNNNLSIENLVLVAGNALQVYDDYRFSAYLFGSGTFWEQTEFKNDIDEKTSPYRFLLDNLMRLRTEFRNKNTKLLLETIDKLLITCILIKFLEEIKDDNGKHTLKTIYKKHSINNFSDALRKSLCVEVLNDLSNEFNGKIFDKFTEDEKKSIQGEDLALLAHFLDADIKPETRQLFLWKQYSFTHLPAEVISAIYENFIQEEAKRKNTVTEKGIVYTPIHLVNFLIDEVMPLNEPALFVNGYFSVLDPACGSGVFLVAAYKRLLQWWAIQNSDQGKIKYPSKKIAQKILEDNIYGVDVKETATLVSIFGLTIALLDKLTPKEIWDNLRFKDLSQKNIKKNNFFDWAITAKKERLSFDLIIGNPPFNIETGKEKKDVLNEETLKQLEFRHKKIPNNNFALHFLEGSMLFAKKVCLIIPSNVLLYTKTKDAQNYRNQIFTDFTVSKIFDFTHLRRILFHKTADTPVVAIVVENGPSKSQSIEHIVIKRTTSTEQQLRFEIDHYDRHSVRWNWAIDKSKQFIWKTNLLGGGQLFHFIYRLSLLPTLKDFINSQNNWPDPIRGFEGGGKILIENQDRIVAINANGEPNISKNVTIKTNNLKNASIYQPPYMIIDQVLGDRTLPVCFIPKNNQFSEKEHLYYNRDFIGISVPQSDEAILKNIFDLIRNKNDVKQLNYQLYVVSTSSNCLILHETAIRQSDILDMPHPENEEYLALSETEKILQDDVLNYYIHLGKAISKNSDGSILHKSVQKEQLEHFGKTFCNALNDIYAKNGKSLQIGTVCQRQSYTIYQFGFGKDGGLQYQYIDKRGTGTNNTSLFPDDKGFDEKTESVIKNKMSNSGAIYNKILRIYEHINGYDYIFLIKPHAQRYWLSSIALKDAGDTFIDLKKEGF